MHVPHFPAAQLFYGKMQQICLHMISNTGHNFICPIDSFQASEICPRFCHNDLVSAANPLLSQSEFDTLSNLVSEPRHCKETQCRTGGWRALQWTRSGSATWAVHLLHGMAARGRHRFREASLETLSGRGHCRVATEEDKMLQGNILLHQAEWQIFQTQVIYPDQRLLEIKWQFLDHPTLVMALDELSHQKAADFQTWFHKSITFNCVCLTWWSQLDSQTTGKKAKSMLSYPKCWLFLKYQSAQGSWMSSHILIAT